MLSFSGQSDHKQRSSDHFSPKGQGGVKSVQLVPSPFLKPIIKSALNGKTCAVSKPFEKET